MRRRGSGEAIQTETGMEGMRTYGRGGALPPYSLPTPHPKKKKKKNATDGGGNVYINVRVHIIFHP